MRFALILIYVIFISTTGHSAQPAISHEIFFDDINRMQGWNDPAFFNMDCLNKQTTASSSHSVTANGRFFEDRLFKAQPYLAILTPDHGGAKRLDNFAEKWPEFADKGAPAISTVVEISVFEGETDSELANRPSPSHNYYDKVVAWIKDVYHAWIAKDHYGSTRLLLLSFGLVGIFGIRRKFKKN